MPLSLLRRSIEEHRQEPAAAAPPTRRSIGARSEQPHRLSDRQEHGASGLALLLSADPRGEARVAAIEQRATECSLRSTEPSDDGLSRYE